MRYCVNNDAMMVDRSSIPLMDLTYVVVSEIEKRSHRGLEFSRAMYVVSRHEGIILNQFAK
jgi:hypothetical protein